MYLSCSEKYRLHYIERIRSDKLYSSLFFGKALDEAFSVLLFPLLKDKTKYPQYENKDPYQVFLDNMSKTIHNEIEIEIKDSEKCEYFKNELDLSLLTNEQKDELSQYAPEVKWLNRFVEQYQKNYKSRGSNKVPDPLDTKLYNYICWSCLVSKGKLMIDAYKEQIIPKIESVESLQESVSIENENGDTISGAIDFIASFKSQPGVLYICDNKSSSKPYDVDSVKTSDQLATYCEYKKINKAAYVVIEKTIYKSKPHIRTQIILDTVPESTMQKTFDQFEEVVHNIDEGLFKKNFDSCFQFGRACPYYALCKSNGNNMNNLIKLGEKTDGTGTKK